jgi:ABC-2 type transport system ATP-binding protein
MQPLRSERALNDFDGLVVSSLTKVYRGGSPRRALDRVSFRAPSSGILSFIGRNGAGKTTLVRILATQLLPTSGSAFIDGIDVVAEPKRLRGLIAIVPQEARTVPWMTPTQTILSYLLWRGFGYGEAKEMAVEALSRVGIERHRDVLNRLLSGGTKRKVLVATVLASGAKIIFLDEPTTGLDPISRKEFWGLLTDLGRDHFTILTTHYLEEAEQLSDRICILESGRLVGFGTMEELRSSVRYQYSIQVSSLPTELPSFQGTVTRAADGSTRILTSYDEAANLGRILSSSGTKFSMGPISLDDIFFHFVNSDRERVEVTT